MPLADPPRPSGDMQSVAQVVDYLIGYVRWFADFINHIDTLNIEELDADVIIANTITAAKMNVTQLSAIAADLGTITAGIIYGAYIATANGTYPRTEMSTTGNQFAAYQSANSFVKMNPAATSTNPGFNFRNGVGHDGLLYMLATDLFLATVGGAANIQISSGIDLFLTAANILKLSCSSLQMNGFTGYSGSFGVVTGVNFGASTVSTKTVTVTNGIVTSVV